MKTKGPPQLSIGPLSPRYGVGKSYIQESWVVTPSVTVCNAASREPLELEKLWANSALRPGALDFKRCPSRGVG